MGERLGQPPTSAPPTGSKPRGITAGTRPPAQIYRQEAARLRSMATSPTFSHIRDELLDVARLYDRLSAQGEGITAHRFGEPFPRASRGG